MQKPKRIQAYKSNSITLDDELLRHFWSYGSLKISYISILSHTDTYNDFRLRVELPITLREMQTEGIKVVHKMDRNMQR